MSPYLRSAALSALSVSPLRTPGVSPGVKALLARELEGAKTLKQNKPIFRECHGRKPVGIYNVSPRRPPLNLTFSPQGRRKG